VTTAKITVETEFRLGDGDLIKVDAANFVLIYQRRMWRLGIDAIVWRIISLA